MVLPNIEMNPPQVYMCSPSWTLLPFKTQIISLSCSKSYTFLPVTWQALTSALLPILHPCWPFHCCSDKTPRAMCSPYVCLELSQWLLLLPIWVSASNVTSLMCFCLVTPLSMTIPCFVFSLNTYCNNITTVGDLLVNFLSCLVDVSSLRTETLLLNFSFPDPRIFWHIASIQYLLNEWI